MSLFHRPRPDAQPEHVPVILPAINEFRAALGLAPPPDAATTDNEKISRLSSDDIDVSLREANPVVGRMLHRLISRVSRELAIISYTDENVKSGYDPRMHKPDDNPQERQLNFLVPKNFADKFSAKLREMAAQVRENPAIREQLQIALMHAEQVSAIKGSYCYPVWKTSMKLGELPHFELHVHLPEMASADLADRLGKRPSSLEDSRHIDGKSFVFDMRGGDNEGLMHLEAAVNFYKQFSRIGHHNRWSDLRTVIGKPEGDKPTGREA